MWALHRLRLRGRRLARFGDIFRNNCTKFGTATRNAAAHPAAGVAGTALQHQVLAHGMATAFGLAAIFDVAVLVLVITLLRDRKPVVPDSPAALSEDAIEIAATADSRQQQQARSTEALASRRRVVGTPGWSDYPPSSLPGRQRPPLLS